MDTKSLSQPIKEMNNQENAEAFARGGIKAMGVCISLSKNEHPLIRATGAILSVVPTGKATGIALSLSLLGFALAKDKKKAFIQRAFCFGSNIVVTGIISNLE